MIYEVRANWAGHIPAERRAEKESGRKERRDGAENGAWMCCEQDKLKELYSGIIDYTSLIFRFISVQPENI